MKLKAYISGYNHVTKIYFTLLESWGFKLSNEVHNVLVASVVLEISAPNQERFFRHDARSDGKIFYCTLLRLTHSYKPLGYLVLGIFAREKPSLRHLFTFQDGFKALQYNGCFGSRQMLALTVKTLLITLLRRFLAFWAPKQQNAKFIHGGGYGWHLS